MKSKPNRALVTAGPTRERIDPVRFISNFSTGRMGYEIARAAKKKGYKVTLVSGPTNLVPPKGVDFVPVEDARQMSKEVSSRLKKTDCLFMTSAVSDWRPALRHTMKIKRAGKVKSLRLVKNPDILYNAGRQKGERVLVGFALESQDLEKSARKKLKKKKLDIIAANKISKSGVPFGNGLTDVLVVTRTNKNKWLKRVTKKTVANYLINTAEGLWRA